VWGRWAFWFSISGHSFALLSLSSPAGRTITDSRGASWAQRIELPRAWKHVERLRKLPLLLLLLLSLPVGETKQTAVKLVQGLAEWLSDSVPA
jgi:hypothetical protein